MELKQIKRQLFAHTHTLSHSLLLVSLRLFLVISQLTNYWILFIVIRTAQNTKKKRFVGIDERRRNKAQNQADTICFASSICRLLLIIFLLVEYNRRNCHDCNAFRIAAKQQTLQRRQRIHAKVPELHWNQFMNGDGVCKKRQPQQQQLQMNVVVCSGFIS